MRFFAVPLVALALAPIALAGGGYQSSVHTLSPSVRSRLVQGGFWHKGCPVSLSDLRVLRVTYWGFDGHAHTGQLVTNKRAAAPLANVFHRIYRLHFRIHYMSIRDTYTRHGPADPSGSFECRQAVPSPCVGGTGTGSWSMHAYGLAVDVNPVENPYVGCGMTHSPTTRPYLDRSRHRKGMVTPAVIAAFRSVGWGWGGSWSGNTKDYMHFSSTGH